MPERGYRVVPSELSFFSRLTDEENHRAEQHRFSARPRAAKVHAPHIATAPASRRDLQRASTPPILDRETEQLFEQFLEWRSRQKDIP